MQGEIKVKKRVRNKKKNSIACKQIEKIVKN